MATYNRCELQLWKEASIRSTLTAYVRWEWPWEQCGKTNQIINVIFVIYCTFMWFSVNGALLHFYLVSYKNANPKSDTYVPYISCEEVLEDFFRVQSKLWTTQVYVMMMRMMRKRPKVKSWGNWWLL